MRPQAVPAAGDHGAEVVLDLIRRYPRLRSDRLTNAPRLIEKTAVSGLVEQGARNLLQSLPPRDLL
jgi:hypothetical protein